jgi:hypothetical protein
MMLSLLRTFLLAAHCSLHASKACSKHDIYTAQPAGLCLRACLVVAHQVIERHLASVSPTRWCAADNRPALDASAVIFAILGGAVALKIGLYFFCVSMRSYSATMLALAEDHLNDIMR